MKIYDIVKSIFGTTSSNHSSSGKDKNESPEIDRKQLKSLKKAFVDPNSTEG